MKSVVCLVVAAMLTLSLAARSATADISVVTFSGDADSGISTANDYVLAVNLGPDLPSPPFPAWNGTTVNGVNFTDGTTAGEGYYITGGLVVLHEETVATASEGLEKIYSRGFTTSNFNIQQVSLSGLEIGGEYEAKFYSSGADNLDATPTQVVLMNGSVQESLGYDPYEVGSRHYIDVKYTAQSDFVSVSFIPGPGGLSDLGMNLYAITNQSVPEPSSALYLGIGIMAIALSRLGRVVRN